MTVSVTIGARKAGDQNIGPKSANHPYHVTERDIVALPLLKCLVGILGEAKIRNSREALFHAVVAICSQEFQRPQNAKDVEQITAHLVLSAFTAIQRQQQNRRTLSA